MNQSNAKTKPPCTFQAKVDKKANTNKHMCSLPQAKVYICSRKDASAYAAELTAKTDGTCQALVCDVAGKSSTSSAISGTGVPPSLSARSTAPTRLCGAFPCAAVDGDTGHPAVAAEKVCVELALVKLDADAD